MEKRSCYPGSWCLTTCTQPPSRCIGVPVPVLGASPPAQHDDHQSRPVLIDMFWLSVWLPIGSTIGLFYSRRRRGRLCTLDAPGWRRLLGLFTARLGGSLLEDFKMHRFISFLFRWLILVSTLSDP